MILWKMETAALPQQEMEQQLEMMEGQALLDFTFIKKVKKLQTNYQLERKKPT